MAPRVKPTVSIVIPVRDGGPGFRQCLASLKAVSPSPEEVIVVEDGESDGSGRVAETFGAQVLRISSAGGPARARNLGARSARADILFFVDADVTLPPEAVGRVAEAFADDPDLTALFGAYDDAPFESNFLSQYKNLLHHYVHSISNEDATTFWGACGAIRRDVFLDMNGFDERYRRPSIEDIELGYRLKRAGHKIRLLKDLNVKHLKRWGVRSLLRADIFYRALPWTRLILKEGRMVDDLNLKMSSRLSVLCTFLLVAALPAAFFVPLSILPWHLAFIGLLAGALLLLNRDVYGFFTHKRGFGFALMTIPWHWFYYFYGGLAFLIETIKFRIGSIGSRSRENDVNPKATGGTGNQ